MNLIDYFIIQVKSKKQKFSTFFYNLFKINAIY